MKRAIFFSKVHELKQQYGFYNPRILCELVRIYCTSFYGSPLWALNSDEHLKLLRSWNTATRTIWNLPYNTNNRFLESLNDTPHLQSIIHSRYIGFMSNIFKSQNPQMKILLNHCKNNMNTVTGQNLSLLKSKYNCDSIQDLVSLKASIK